MKATIKITIAVLLFLMSGNVLAAGMQKVSFKNKIVMREPELKLRDLIEAENTDINFLRQYGDLVIGNEEDIEDHLVRSQIYAVFHKAGINLDNIQFRINGGIQIERGQLVDLPMDATNKVKNIVKGITNIPSNDITILKARLLPKLPEENPEHLFYKKVEALNLKKASNSKFRVIVENVEGSQSEHTLFVQFQVETTVLMAKDGLQAGETLSQDDYLVGRQRIHHLNEMLIRSQNLKEGTFKIVHPIAKDQVFKKGMLRKSLVVADGTLVTLSYKSRGLNIKGLGRVVESGEVGKIVRLENIDSKRIVKGRLVSQDVAEVSFE